MNKLEIDDIEWRYAKHITYTNESHFVWRDERFKIQYEKITKRNGHGGTGSSKEYYFIDEVKREFTDLQELCNCWNERNEFDDPNNEITWVKKITPIIKINQSVNG